MLRVKKVVMIDGITAIVRPVHVHDKDAYWSGRCVNCGKDLTRSHFTKVKILSIHDFYDRHGEEK